MANIAKKEDEKALQLTQEDYLHGAKRVGLQAVGMTVSLIAATKAKQAMEKSAQTSGKPVSKMMKVIVPTLLMVGGGFGAMSVKNDEVAYFLEGMAAGGAVNFAYEMLRKEDGTPMIQMLGNIDEDDDIPTNGAITMLDEADEDEELDGFEEEENILGNAESVANVLD